MTAILAPPLVFQGLSAQGVPLAGGLLASYIAGTTTPQATYVDSTQSTPNTNPIVLNASGQCALWLDPAKVYKFVLTDVVSNQLYVTDQVQGSLTAAAVSTILTQAYLGSILNPQTPAEIAAGVVPVNLAYLPGIVDRYGNNTTPGTTDMTAAIKNALAVQRQSPGIPVTFLPNLYLVTDTCLKLLSTDFAVVIQGVPQRTIILNKAAANKPTIQLLGAQYWTIQGLVLIGATGFINHGIELTKDGSANRTAFGTIRDIVAQTNGIGIHITDTNTVYIDRFDYWPTSASAYGGTVDIVGGSNNQPGGIVADGTGAVNDVHVRNVNTSGVTTIANGGAAIKIDGTVGGPFFNMSVESLLSERSPATAQRALWVRNVTGGRFTNIFSENNDIAVDSSSVACTFDTIEAGNTGTVTISGTSSLISLRNCVGKALSIDATCSYITEQNNQWGSGADSNLASHVFSANVTSNGVDLIERIGNSGLSFGQKPTLQSITANGQTFAIGTAGTNYTTLTFISSGAFTGLILPAGIADGQILIMKSQTANDQTFAAVGTSRVANGVNCVIKGLTARMFIWDAGQSWWFPLGASVF